MALGLGSGGGRMSADAIAAAIDASPSAEATLGSALLFTPSGDDADPRLYQSKLRDVVSVRDFGALGTGDQDDAGKFQNAIDYAATFSATGGRPAIRVPAGVYLLNSTVTIPTFVTLIGDGSGATVLRPGMTDGSPALHVVAGAQWVTIAAMSIASTIDDAAFDAGSVEGVNCTGLLLGGALDADDEFASRYSLRDLRIYGLQKGLRISGFIGRAVEIYINRCNLGADLYVTNSTTLGLRIEACRKSFRISKSLGVHFDQLLDEGSVANAVASTVDDCVAVQFSAPYFEAAPSHPRAEPFVTFGGTTECKSVEVISARVVGSSGMATEIHPLVFDRVDGLAFSGTVADAVGRRGILRTSNVKNLRRWDESREYGVANDASLSDGVAINYFPNSNFDLWFRGWENFYLARCTRSQEQTLVRRGKNALKLTAGTHATSDATYGVFSIVGAPCLAMRGRTLRLGAWIWVPDITEYDEVSPTALVGMLLQSYNGASYVSSNTVNQKWSAGTWNFISTQLAVQSDATSVYVYLFIDHDGAGTTTGNEYIVVDSVSIVDAAVPEWRQREGYIRDDVALPTLQNGRIVLSGSAAPTDATMTYEAGDRLLYDAPTAGGYIGVVCTTDGAPGTWKTFGEISP